MLFALCVDVFEVGLFMWLRFVSFQSKRKPILITSEGASALGMF